MFVLCFMCFYLFFFFNDTATTEIYTLSLHDALPIYTEADLDMLAELARRTGIALDNARLFAAEQEARRHARSEEHTSELQSQFHLVCRLLLEKKKTIKSQHDAHQSHSLLLPPTRRPR